MERLGSRSLLTASVHREELYQAFACIEHAGLHGVFRHLDDCGHLLHRLVVIVDQVDHGPVLGRKLRETFLND